MSSIQQYAMHQCPNMLSPLPPIILREPTDNNSLYHLISEHSDNGTIAEIPGELLVKMFIHKAEEEALGIDQDATEGTEEITKHLIVMDLQ